MNGQTRTKLIKAIIQISVNQKCYKNTHEKCDDNTIIDTIISTSSNVTTINDLPRMLL